MVSQIRSRSQSPNPSSERNRYSPQKRPRLLSRCASPEIEFLMINNMPNEVEFIPFHNKSTNEKDNLQNENISPETLPELLISDTSHQKTIDSSSFSYLEGLLNEAENPQKNNPEDIENLMNELSEELQIKHPQKEIIDFNPYSSVPELTYGQPPSFYDHEASTSYTPPQTMGQIFFPTLETNIPSEGNIQSPDFDNIVRETPIQSDTEMSYRQWCKRANMNESTLYNATRFIGLDFINFIPLVLAKKFDKDILNLTEDERQTSISDIKEDIKMVRQELKENKININDKNYDELINHIYKYENIYKNIDILREISPFFNVTYCIKKSKIYENVIYTAKLNKNFTVEDLAFFPKEKKNKYDEHTLIEIKKKLEAIEKSSEQKKTKYDKKLINRPLSVENYIKIMIPFHKILTGYKENNTDDKTYLQNIDIENLNNKDIIRHIKNILKLYNIFLSKKVNNQIETMLKNKTEFQKVIKNVNFDSLLLKNLHENILKIFPYTQKDYRSYNPFFQTPKNWCNQAGIERINVIDRAKSSVRPLNLEISLDLTIAYYKESHKDLKISSQDISNIPISDKDIKKALGVTHIELIKRHKTFFGKKHDGILKHILKNENIYNIDKIKKISQHFENSRFWCRDVELPETILTDIKRKHKKLSINDFLRLMIPIYKIFTTNEKHQQMHDNIICLEEISLNKLQYLDILKKVIPLTQDILRELHGIETDHLNKNIDKYLQEE